MTERSQFKYFKQYIVTNSYACSNDDRQPALHSCTTNQQNLGALQTFFIYLFIFILFYRMISFANWLIYIVKKMRKFELKKKRSCLSFSRWISLPGFSSRRQKKRKKNSNNNKLLRISYFYFYFIYIYINNNSKINEITKAENRNFIFQLDRMVSQQNFRINIRRKKSKSNEKRKIINYQLHASWRLFLWLCLSVIDNNNNYILVSS